MATISMDVEVEIDLDDLDTSDLARTLIKKQGWQKALEGALALKKDSQSFNHTGADTDDDADIRALVENYKLGRPVDAIIATIAYNNFGFVL